MNFFSIIIPLYNRPAEIRELLDSLVQQAYKHFEVVVVEDGSTEKSEDIVASFRDRLEVKYFFKENSGPGLSRNYGAERASGDYFIFLDSDCIVPVEYLQEIENELSTSPVDAFGGPDRAHESFTDQQKAINYSMTSILTTGGIRGKKKSMEKFHPRSFNMGFSRRVFETTKGFSGMRFGEDIDMSIRIMEAGFQTRLFPAAYVYHKRRTSWKKFFKQIYNSGIARINLYLLHPASLKVVHLLPACFVVGVSVLVIGAILVSIWSLLPLLLWACLIFIDSLIENRSIVVAFYSICASFIQLFAYGIGFIHAFFKRIVFRKGEFNVFVKNFYK
ncbi:MAG: glycosyltransferase [Odoribacter splanchnicus]|nr:glycosyltransferase [Odoribacter splanchnicus]